MVQHIWWFCTVRMHMQEARKPNNKKKGAIHKWVLLRPGYYATEAMIHTRACSWGNKFPVWEAAWGSTREVWVWPPCNDSVRTSTLLSGNPWLSGRHTTGSDTIGRKKMHNLTSDSGNWQSEKQLSRITICLTAPPSPPQKKKKLSQHTWIWLSHEPKHILHLSD